MANQKITIDYTQLNSTPGNYGTANLYMLPAGGIVTGCTINVTTAFVVPGSTAVNVMAGNSIGLSKYSFVVDATVIGWSSIAPATNDGFWIEDLISATQLIATLSTDGDATNLTAGVMDIYLVLDQLP